MKTYLTITILYYKLSYIFSFDTLCRASVDRTTSFITLLFVAGLTCLE